MSFQIDYDKQPTKFLKKLDKYIAKRIMDKIDDVLLNNPVPHDAKTIVGNHGLFRIRIGDYRALYRINYQENKIIIIKIDSRENVY
ncbi:type II toxin-antitoxin system RelE/ParE family toxin [Candidatus Woesearchaeota archaeon]|nr:type II toxin-antitoxin system RelE/ParE family toxin [Candidatus Woesearchaeota archaeon]